MKTQRCDKSGMRKQGNQWIAEAVCQEANKTVSSHGTREFSSENAYRDESTQTYDPPSSGRSQVHMVADGKWPGPCRWRGTATGSADAEWRTRSSKVVAGACHDRRLQKSLSRQTLEVGGTLIDRRGKIARDDRDGRCGRATPRVLSRTSGSR